MTKKDKQVSQATRWPGLPLLGQVARYFGAEENEAVRGPVKRYGA